MTSLWQTCIYDTNPTSLQCWQTNEQYALAIYSIIMTYCREATMDCYLIFTNVLIMLMLKMGTLWKTIAISWVVCYFFLIYINFGCPHLPRCTQAFSARSEQGSPLWGPGLSSGRLSLLQTQAPQLCHVGSAVPRHVGSSWTRYQTHVPCMGRGIPNHWTMREVLLCFLYSHLTDRERTLRGKATEVSSARLAVAQGLSSVFFWCRSPPTTR